MAPAERTVQTHVVLCKWCEKHVNATVIGEYSYFNDVIGEPLCYQLLRCPACNSPILVVVDFEEDDGRFTSLEPRIMFPEPHKPLAWDVPKTIRSSYDEAVKGLTARAYTASAIMCRRTLEALVAEKLAKKKITLAKGLKEMRANGLIDSSLFEWAEMLRVAGNKAAHDVNEKVSKQDAQDLIEFSHALIEYVFTYKQKFEQFKERARKAPAPKRSA